MASALLSHNDQQLRRIDRSWHDMAPVRGMDESPSRPASEVHMSALRLRCRCFEYADRARRPVNAVTMASISLATLRPRFERIHRDHCPSATVSNVLMHLAAMCRRLELIHSLGRLAVTVRSASIEERRKPRQREWTGARARRRTVSSRRMA
jgi:hypothetical protein